MSRDRRTLIANAGCASFWIGTFSSEEELETFINSAAFENEQGFIIESPLLPFHAYEPHVEPRGLLSKLMRDPRMVDAAMKKLPKIAFNALIRHDGFRYNPSAAPRRKRRMVFLGTFRRR